MNLLLDTHTLICFFNSDLLSEKAKQSIIELQHQKFVSIASIWEVTIKISLNKLVFNGKTQGFLDLIDNNGFEMINIDKKYILELEFFPLFIEILLIGSSLQPLFQKRCILLRLMRIFKSILLIASWFYFA
jgi:PIN domain nuclease of toxin-antitoxin system